METVKWGHPCYLHAGHNIVILGALRGDFPISFFDAALLRDSERVLEQQGPNTRHADTMRCTHNLQVATRGARVTKLRIRNLAVKGAQER